MWKSAQEKGDAPLVTVMRDGERVTIRKEGETLLIHCDDHSEKSEVRISGALVSALLSGSGEELDFGAAVRAMGSAGAGEILVVRGDDSTVRIWVDGEPEGHGAVK
jgi:hypothetical protein